MIDTDIIKNDPQRIKDELKARGITDLDVDRLVELDGLRRKYQQAYDEKRSEQKKAKDAKSGTKLKKEVQQLEEDLRAATKEFEPLYLSLPNFHAEDTPVGKDEEDNQTVKESGEKREIKSAKPHYEIPAIAPLIDMERGAKVSGNRFWYLKGALVQLQFAITQYALDFYLAKGYVPMRPPAIVKEEAMIGTGFFPADADVIYTVEGETDEKERPAQYLSGTAEVPLAAYHSGEKLDIKDLPVRYLGYSPAYRRESGSYGRDTKGITRGHEFDKIELFVYADPAKSWEMHEQMQAEAEEFWTSLGVPFRVLNMCTGDIGAPNAKKYDTEAWLPGERRYREVGSNSHDTDFQARRLRIKTSTGEYVHTLNNTATAIGRTIIAITENYQQPDGSVDMPEVLQKYLPFKMISKE